MNQAQQKELVDKLAGCLPYARVVGGFDVYEFKRLAEIVVKKHLLESAMSNAATVPFSTIPSEAVKIAVICHEANRTYCAVIGDNSQLAWNDAPDWQKQSAIKGVELHIAALKEGRKLSPSASHDAWLEEKRRDGWAYGPTKDPEKKLHPCFIEFDKLPAEQRAKDFLFAAVVEALYESLAFAGDRDTV